MHTMAPEFEAPIERLVAAIKADYVSWPGIGNTEVGARMRDEFCNGVKIVEGKKYIKIITGGSVWGFVVKEAEGRFNRGDVLKAAGWATPAKNFARGNVFAEMKSPRWTGA